MAAMCTLMFAYELYDAVCVTYQMRTFSVGGKGIKCRCEQKRSYVDTAEV